MGKRPIKRARGKGGPRYRAPSFRYLGRVKYHPSPTIKGKVLDIVHDPARGAPVAIVRFEDEKTLLHIAAEKLEVGSTIEYDKKIAVGNVVTLENIPIGTKIFAMETYPGSGPKLCRSAGSFGTVSRKSETSISVQLASGIVRDLNPKCRATIGIPAGAEKVEKPWAKAGLKAKAMRARGKIFPRVKLVAMTAVNKYKRKKR